MIRILQGQEVKKLDQLHCERSGQSSYELMEMAATGFVSWFLKQEFPLSRPVYLFIGAGNNGGDGLAIARQLSHKKYRVTTVFCFDSDEQLTEDSKINFDRLPEGVNKISRSKIDFSFPSEGICIDAFLGVGLKGSLREKAKEVINLYNELQGVKIAIDIPSGLPSEGIAKEEAVKADYTISFAFPKLSLLLPENAPIVGELIVVDIGINDELYAEFNSDLYFIQANDIPSMHRKFHRFSHKGDFGKILLVGGSLGKMGAMVLAAKSAFRTGAGLVSCHIEESERSILQTAIPEAMVNWGLTINSEAFDAIGIGPGWGTEQRKEQLRKLFQSSDKPMVLDADALNVLAKNPDLLPLVTKNSILTPHIGEFERLVGQCSDHFERMQKALHFAKKYRVIIILKGANTLITLPDGRQLLNSTGTQHMATAGAGDVLTGMLTAFLGMGYSPEQATICGVFHHGLAGELAGKALGRSTMASDIISYFPPSLASAGLS